MAPTTVEPTTTLEPTTVDPCPSECICDRPTRTARCETNALTSGVIPAFPSYITTLTLSDNAFPTLPADAFSGLPDLIRLYLVSCSIGRIEPGAFNGLTHLRILHLRYNQILSLVSTDESVFGGLDELEELDLRNNNIQSLHAMALSPLVNLRVLFLDDNKISTLQDGILATNTLLNKITLKNMLLTQIPQTVFSSTPNLEHLELSGNKVRSIPAEAFNGLSALRELVLAAMTLESIDDNAFNGLENLEILDLLSNNLVGLTKEVLQPLTSIQTLILSANPWNCNCQMYNLVDYIKATSINYYTSPWTCVTPNRLNSQRVYTIPEDEFACLPIITSDSQTKTVSYKTQAYFECVANGDPAPTIEWYRPDGQKVTAMSNLENVYTALNGNVLIVQQASKEDDGIFECRATNDLGEDSVNYGLIVQDIPTTVPPEMSAGPTTQHFTCPNALIDVSATEIRDTSVEMNWVEYNHPMTKGYIVEIAEFASVDSPQNVLIEPATNITYVVQDLLPGTNYIICVSTYLPPCPAQTPYEQCKQFKTQGAKNELAALEFKHRNEIIGTALSVFFGTLLILASIFVILWQYRKPKDYTKYDFQVSKDTTLFADVEHGVELQDEIQGEDPSGRYVARKPSARFNPEKHNNGMVMDDENDNTSTFKTAVEVHGSNGINSKSNEYEMGVTGNHDGALGDITEEEEAAAASEPMYDSVPDEGSKEHDFNKSRTSTVGLVDAEVTAF